MIYSNKEDRKDPDHDQDFNRLCPACGKETLERVELGNGRYTIKCKACGLSRGELEPDEKKGVV